MDKEFLEELGLAPEVVEAILQQQEKLVADHEEKLRALQLSHAVETAVQKAGGRNLKAVTALLDMDAIRESEDPSAALDTALQQLKKENGWLFESSAPPQYAPFTGADTTPQPKAMTLAGALRERMKK